MEGRVDDPPVLGPFFALVATHSVVQQPLKTAKLELLKVAELVGQNFSHQLGLGDGHPRHWPKPGDRHFTCQPIFTITVMLVSSFFNGYTFPFCMGQLGICDKIHTKTFIILYFL